MNDPSFEKHWGFYTPWFGMNDLILIIGFVAVNKGLQKKPSQAVSFLHDEIDLTDPTLKVTFEHLVVAISFPCIAC